MDTEGQLYDYKDSLLDDEALQTLLAEVYAYDAHPAFRAIGISVMPSIDRRHDLAARARIMRLAGAAGVWVLPIFTTAQPH